MTLLLTALTLDTTRYYFSRLLDCLPYNEMTCYVLDPILTRIPAGWMDQND